MAELTDAQMDAALARGQAARRHEPRAQSARYDRQLGRVVVDLTNGCTFSFPPRLAQGLETATDEQLAQVELLGAGSGLHWEALDTDLSIPGLLAGLFGTQPIWRGKLARRPRPPKLPQPGPTAPKAAGRERQEGASLELRLNRLGLQARVSTEEQGTDPQLDELRASGCATIGRLRRTLFFAAWSPARR